MIELGLNTIISGAVGSGKNYQSILYAISIVDGVPLSKLNEMHADQVRKRYNQLCDEGQIFQTSFSENYTYESFVEQLIGIQQNGMPLVQEGILKILALNAKQALVQRFIAQVPPNQMSISFDQLYKAFIRDLRDDKISTFTSSEDKKFLLHKLENRGNFYVRGENSYSTYYISRNELRKFYVEGVSPGSSKVDKKKPAHADFPFANPDAYLAIASSLKQFEGQYINMLAQQQGSLDQEQVANFELPQDIAGLGVKNFVLIIDHIDAPNAYRIFGDIMPLLESAKRDGRQEAAFVYLQHSKTAFSLPPNLYIIGLTNMGFSGNQIANLQLYNNFDVMQVVPDAHDIWPKGMSSVIDTIDMKLLYVAINKRLELLGVDTFMVNPYLFRSIGDFARLKHLFECRLIPQLRRALSGDLMKLRLILGREFVSEMIVDPNNDLLDYDPKLININESVLVLTSPKKWTKQSFIKVYES